MSQEPQKNSLGTLLVLTALACYGAYDAALVAQLREQKGFLVTFHAVLDPPEKPSQENEGTPQQNVDSSDDKKSNGKSRSVPQCDSDSLSSDSSKVATSGSKDEHLTTSQQDGPFSTSFHDGPRVICERGDHERPKRGIVDTAVRVFRSLRPERWPTVIVVANHFSCLGFIFGDALGAWIHSDSTVLGISNNRTLKDTIGGMLCYEYCGKLKKLLSPLRAALQTLKCAQSLARMFSRSF